MENPICSGGFGTASMTVLTIINCISGILTAGGNALVLIAILRTPSLRVASNVFIGSLAAADLTIGLVMNPIYAAIVCLNITDTTHPLNVAEQYLWIHTVITTTFNLAGNATRASSETFGSCNYTDFVAEAVGICEKRFYMDLANDLKADCRAFSHSRSCTQSVFNRYCNDTIPVPTENRFNPFCTDPGNVTTIAFQASKKSKNATKKRVLSPGNQQEAGLAGM
ncbi:hypothetical protein ACROYT_G034461 [Oculina patagonica]